MEKEVEMLTESLTFSRKRDKVQSEYNKIHRPYFRIKLFSGIVVGIILYIVLTLIAVILTGMDTDDFVGITIIISICLTLFLNRLQIMHRVKKNGAYIEELKNEYQDLSLLIKNTGLHDQYSYTYAIEKLLNYLNVGRADSFKEALNLFEAELRHDEQLNKLKEMHVQQKKQLQELQSIKNSARF